MTFQFILSDLKELNQVADEIIQKSGNQKFFALYGEMGAGKTTLIKALCSSLEVTDKVTSPTFALMNEYKRKNGEPVFHFDFYRIKNETEAYDIGYENFFFSDSYCFVEWPEKIQNLLHFPHAVLSIKADDEKRFIELTTASKQ